MTVLLDEPLLTRDPHTPSGWEHVQFEVWMKSGTDLSAMDLMIALRNYFDLQIREMQ